MFFEFMEKAKMPTIICIRTYVFQIVFSGFYYDFRLQISILISIKVINDKERI